MNAPARAREGENSRRFLEIYLRDHHAGSTAGLSLVRRCRQSNRGTTWDAMLAPVEDEIAEDRETLESMMRGLAIEPSPIKSALGALGEVASRLKSNGRLFGYSPLSRMIELETLAAGIETKRNLWRALRHVDDGEVLDVSVLDALIERAESQRKRVLELHDRAADDALAHDRTSVIEVG
jgi:hypothetical protein